MGSFCTPSLMRNNSALPQTSSENLQGCTRSYKATKSNTKYSTASFSCNHHPIRFSFITVTAYMRRGWRRHVRKRGPTGPGAGRFTGEKSTAPIYQELEFTHLLLSLGERSLPVRIYDISTS